MSSKPVVLAIGGSDNCAGAGIQADLKTCQALGVYCVTTLSAVTSQNDFGVRHVQYVGNELLESQLEATLEVVRPDAVKIGMMPCVSSIETVARFLEKNKLTNIVIDPVLSATAGGNLSGNHHAKETLVELLFPISTLVTPNIPEFEILSGAQASEIISVPGIDDRITDFMKKNCVSNLLLKGGHSKGNECTDRLYRVVSESEIIVEEFTDSRVQTRNTHGTGCTLSSAVASYLAMGLLLSDAVKKSKLYITLCLKRAAEEKLFPINGPLSHL